MSLLCRSRLALAVGLALVVLSGVRGADDPPQKEAVKVTKSNVTFRTVDYVDLKGTLYTPDTGKKNACVLLLHNMTRKGGGSRNDDGWDALADDLGKEGYTVLSFDFRGHGDSTTVGKEFWDKVKFPHNQPLLRGKPIIKLDDYPTKIDYKDFPPTGSYYPHLVDDIAAAKAFLDTKAGGAAGNTVLIGAGEGATLGALWLTAEYRRYRERTENAVMRQPYNPEPEPEGKDMACAIWLTINGSIGDKAQGTTTLNTGLQEVGGKQNTMSMPMLFLYGKDDPGKGKSTASYALTKMIPGYRMMEDKEGLNPDKNHKFTRDFSVNTKLEGSQLLQKTLPTNKIIIAYLKDVMEDRGSRETKRHEPEKFRFFWASGLHHAHLEYRQGSGRRIHAAHSRHATGRQITRLEQKETLLWTRNRGAGRA